IEKWRRKENNHKKELANILSREPDEIIGDNAAVYKLNTPKSIISAAARRFAAKTEFNYVIVINAGLLEDRTQIYVRRKNGLDNSDTAVFKKIALDLGGQAGGKDEVAGIIIDDSQVDEFLDSVRNNIGTGKKR
ncbi:MAG: DHHA1 domain-containing protein, partial [Elusimicrobiota bacterium]|nr:DHHA1 domain-containing protein [Elusimicrobiota bacterium]